MLLTFSIAIGRARSKVTLVISLISKYLLINYVVRRQGKRKIVRKINVEYFVINGVT